MAKNNQVIVENLESNDNSVIKLSPGKMTELEMTKGDPITLAGVTETVGIVLQDESCPSDRILINAIVRRNLGAKIGDAIFIDRTPDIKYGTNLRILPILDTIEGYDGNIFEAFLKPYFFESYRPVHQGDIIPITAAAKTIEFKVTDCKPHPSCIVAPDTMIHCEGTITREAAEES